MGKGCTKVRIWELGIRNEEGVTLEGMRKKRTLFQVVLENNILTGYCNGKGKENGTLML